ncbi:MAG: heliorhodopsin HeR [Chloroflexi bacterium]|nr:heliorhodopsin HeR [Chloroflexota bacterium]
MAQAVDMSEQGRSLSRLRWWNLVLGLVHLGQAALILALSTDFAIPVSAVFSEGPPGTALPTAEELFDVPFGPAIALFLLLAAADHLLMAAPGVWGWYRRNLLRRINYARWIEYSVSASIMMVLIAMLTGITNLYALLGIFAVNAAMIAFGLLMERGNEGGRSLDWTPFWLGSVAGIVPWIAVTIAIVGAETRGSGDVPPFVYGIFVSLFLFFNSFAVNMVLQYRRIGPWRDYLFGERGYLVLSLGAKSALAWQVFGGTLS